MTSDEFISLAKALKDLGATRVVADSYTVEFQSSPPIAHTPVPLPVKPKFPRALREDVTEEELEAALEAYVP